MKKIALLSVLAALLCGIAVYVYFDNLEDRVAEAAVSEPVEMVTVVAAAADIPAYTEITEELLTLREYPAEYVHEDAARDPELVLGLLSDGFIAQGETIMLTALGIGEDLGAALSYEVPDGMRAMTIDVSVITGVGGYLTKGDLVDLALNLSLSPAEETEEETEAPEAAEGGEETVPGAGTITTRDGVEYVLPDSLTEILLQSVEILRVGDVTFDAASGGLYSTITVLLSPEDCLRLVAAQESGAAIWALLRQRDDASPVDTESYSFAAMIN